ncbi:MAG: Rho termination factor N-terminal domain-containing protein, partial [Solirubrobacterales bacterium]|nr:Rho termination factor N-terminal domain-containing protein [Solirubrobacterales bacterium]
LADLHALASELSIDGYRRLRKAELIDAILTRQGGEPAAEEAGAVGAPEPESESESDEERGGSRRRRGRRGGRSRSASREDDGGATGGDEDDRGATPGEEDGASEAAAESPDDGEAEADRPSRGGRREAEREEEIVAGEVELLANGTGFLRVNPPEPSEDDVYVSAAQVKRCELVPGDRISGPRRAPRRSERFASLIRIDTINGRPADEVADSTRFEDLPAAFPSERFRLGSDDPTIKAIEWLTPFGEGSRVTIAGPAHAGKTEALRRLADTLAEHHDIQVSLVLAGVRPEEIAEWQEGPVAPAAAVSFAASADAQAQTAERVVDQARRLAARGSHAVVLIDSLGGMQPHAARKLLASARNVADGGSLTVIATAPEPLGGETTVIALDPLLARTGRYPAVDLLASWTIRAELLVGEAGAEAIARARMEAVES